jgi:hypothetical protein
MDIETPWNGDDLDLDPAPPPDADHPFGDEGVLIRQEPDPPGTEDPPGA